MWGVRMTIEMLEKGLILVSLRDEDMRRYALYEDRDAPSDDGLASRGPAGRGLASQGPAGRGLASQGLKSLLYRVSEVCGLDYHGKSFLIELLPSKDGCLLIISVRSVRRRRKTYRIKRSRTTRVCVFFDADAMLDYLRLGCTPPGAAVYRRQERYVLVSNGSFDDRIGEYGDLHTLSLIAAARIREHGTLLWQEKLQSRHISDRAVAVRDTAPRNTVR